MRYEDSMKRRVARAQVGEGRVAKVAVSVPRDILHRAQEAVERGRAKTLSALVAEALDYYVDKGDLDLLLKELAEQYPPSRKDKAWAERVLKEAAALQEQH